MTEHEDYITRAFDTLDQLKRATGDLPPELVAKTLRFAVAQRVVQEDIGIGTYFDAAETVALRAATFEVPS